MKQTIRHRRLYAFYQSKVLNALMIAVVVSLLMMAYTKSALLPAICASLALVCFIGYSLWFWIIKPKSVIINDWLSDMNGLYAVYFLIVAAMDAPGQWWYIVPVALSVVLLFIALTTDHDEKFHIG